ncbi:glycosyltransferase family 39 protein [Paenibacillus chartarius]|uniref:Glycosyltransferase family 39 protein n=1 Tax=Paenibacillus chartarius TaxID=747481 RepID=A0ABV6DU48_9BACL
MSSATRKWRVDFLLVGIMLLSACLNGYNIWTETYANTYYTTAVASMLQSWHNFFYASLDPAGSVTVDKPPVVFWIQTLSAYVFGLYGWSVILPQALAGVGSVWLLYRLVKPTFGLAAARLSALTMACTPIAVAVARTNNIDSMLVFTLLVSVSLLFRAVKHNSLFSLLGSFAVIGIAFNMKMLQAYMIVPAVYLFFWLAAKVKWKTKLSWLAGATAILLITSLSWALVVEAVPQDQRPYIGSSQTNSVLELAFGYNGISRLTGSQGPGQGSRDDGSRPQAAAPDGAGGARGASAADGMGGAAPNGADGVPDGAGGASAAEGMGGAAPIGAGAAPGAWATDGAASSNGPFGQGGPGGSGSGGMFGTGTKGPLRLFQSALSGQASWLIPFAAFASIALLAGWRRRATTEKHRETVFWLAWLIPAMAFFSVAGFFHHYYLIMLAPPIAALVGSGAVELWQAYSSRTGWQSWLLPAAVAVTGLFQWYIVQPYNSTIGSAWSLGIAIGGVAPALLLVVWRQRDGKMAQAAALAGLLVLFVGPTYWAATPIAYGQNSMLPQAGPGSANGREGMGMPPGMAQGNLPGRQPTQPADGQTGARPGQTADAAENAIPATAQDGTAARRNGTRSDGGADDRGPGMGDNQQADVNLYNYLKQNARGKYLFATTDYNAAAPSIINYGAQVITLGGFSGSDPVYTTAELEELVKSGDLTYFLISGGGMGGRSGSPELTAWIQEHGTVVSSSEWGSTASGSGNGTNMPGGRGGAMTLYKVTL